MCMYGTIKPDTCKYAAGVDLGGGGGGGGFQGVAILSSPAHLHTSNRHCLELVANLAADYQYCIEGYLKPTDCTRWFVVHTEHGVSCE